MSIGNSKGGSRDRRKVSCGALGEVVVVVGIALGLENYTSGVVIVQVRSQVRQHNTIHQSILIRFG